jgi:hypothetical protein
MTSTVLGLMPSTRKKVRYLISTFAALGCLILGYTCWRVSIPDAEYPDVNISAEGGAYWTFSKGKIHLTGGGRTFFAGYYWRTNGVWLYGPAPGADPEGTLKLTLAGIQMLSPSKPHTSKFLPRRGVSWLIHSRQLEPQRTNAITN